MTPAKTLGAIAAAALTAGLVTGCAAAVASGTPVDQSASGTSVSRAYGGSASLGSASAPSASASCASRRPASSAGGAPRSSSGPSPALAAVQFDGPRRGWVVGAGRILATSDGGRVWARQYDGRAGLDQVDFIDAEHGWATGPRTLLRTTDGGDRWTSLAEPCRGDLTGVHFVSPSLGYAVAGGSLVRSTDGGLTWAPVPGAPGDPRGACFANPVDGYLAAPGRIWRTTDGGRRWALALAEPRAPGASRAASLDYPEIECAGPDAAWVLFLGVGAAMGHAPYLAYTTQDGREWHPLFEERYSESGLRPGLKLPEGPGSYPGPFSAIDTGAAVFVGYSPMTGDGVAPLELVSDRGYTRTRVGDVAAVNEPIAAAFVSAARGWVIGENLRTGAFAIEATGDGGRAWATQYTTGEPAHRQEGGRHPRYVTPAPPAQGIGWTGFRS